MPQQRTSLKSISQAAGVSYKTIKKIYGEPGSPVLSQPLEEHLAFVRRKCAKAVELPADYEERASLAKLLAAERRAEKLKGESEKAALDVQKMRGQLMPRTEIHAQGLAIGEIISATVSGWAKSLPSQIIGKREAEITQIIETTAANLLNEIKERLAGV